MPFTRHTPARALSIGLAAFALSASPAAASEPADAAREAHAHVLDWGSAALGGGAVSVLVLGTVGAAGAGVRQRLRTTP
jgi:hypothetical protein